MNTLEMQNIHRVVGDAVFSNNDFSFRVVKNCKTIMLYVTYNANSYSIKIDELKSADYLHMEIQAAIKRLKNRKIALDKAAKIVDYYCNECNLALAESRPMREIDITSLLS